VYVLIHKELQENKFDAVALPGVLLGISDVHSGYKVHMLHNNQVKVARDVCFYKEIFPFHQSPMTDLQWMNPIDCPRPDESIIGQFQDPFLAGLQLKPSAQRSAEHADLYTKKTDILNEYGEETFGKVHNVTSLVIEGVENGCAMTKRNMDMMIYKGVLLNMSEISPYDAVNSQEGKRWIDAFKCKYNAIMKTGTFVPPSDEVLRKIRNGEVKSHRTRPVLTIKHNENG
jgi:hypothetical protein